MRPAEPEHITRLLQNAPSDRAAADEVFALVYDQLRGIARQRMQDERRDHTLDATALVHEAWLKLVGDREVPWQNRAHFFVAAAEAMRHVLLDHAKARGRAKRGGAWRRVPLNVAELAETDDPSEILSLDEAVCRLIQCDPEIGQVVRLRFYAGLNIEETAAALGVSPATVKRRWEFARTWLFRELSDLQTNDQHGGKPEQPGAGV
ncbi:MAG TPA: sigma-70 family RNA polymerase sigma factor [Phycisphaerae bacterium]|jgi:RNA polymerase sigma factor (TIGR02999 family)